MYTFVSNTKLHGSFCTTIKFNELKIPLLRHYHSIINNLHMLYHLLTLLLAHFGLSQVWEEITISEESESGTQVSSVIRVPSQTSVYVTSLLFAVCQEISRIGGQALEQSVLSELSSLMMLSIVVNYEELLQKYRRDDVMSSSSAGAAGGDVRGIPQQCALQLLFNLNFLSNILLVQEVSRYLCQCDSTFVHRTDLHHLTF